MLRRWSAKAPVLLAGLWLGCDPSAWFGASEREPEPPPTEREPVPEQPPALERLEADLGTSKIGFAVGKATSEHVAQFEDFEAHTQLVDGAPTQLDITIQMASVRADRETLTKHLRSPEFFDVARYPTSTFAATTFSPDPGESQTHTVTGTLTLHGVERSITFPAQIRVEKATVAGRAQLTIDPADYGIESELLREELVDPDVLLDIELTFPRP